MEQRTLAAAYKFYCEKDLENAHSALADIEATHEVFLAQLGRYESLEKDIDFLAEFSRQGDNTLLDFAGRIAKNDEGDAMYNFGKHKGKTVREVHEEEPGYYGWMLGANFPLYTKQVLRAEFEKIKKELTDSSEKTPKVVVKKHTEIKKSPKPATEENLEDKLAELQAKFGKK
jgi:DNA polymerase-3 subunit epsilon